MADDSWEEVVKKLKQAQKIYGQAPMGATPSQQQAPPPVAVPGPGAFPYIQSPITGGPAGQGHQGLGGNQGVPAPVAGPVAVLPNPLAPPPLGSVTRCAPGTHQGWQITGKCMVCGSLVSGMTRVDFREKGPPAEWMSAQTEWDLLEEASHEDLKNLPTWEELDEADRAKRKG